jgi:signal peptidase II
MFGKHFNKNIIYLFFLSLLLVSLDQLTKNLVINKLELYESAYLLPFLNFTFVVNYGFAFGFLNSPSLNQLIVSLVIFSIIFYFLYLLIKTQDQIFRFSLVLILSGAIGNFLDRIFRGFVIDFIDIYILDYHWPVFNLADSWITLGFMILIFNILFMNKKI